MTFTVKTDRWTWDDRLQPQVIRAFDEPSGELAWCDQLENAPTDALTGKMVCVCAAMAIAREVLSEKIGNTGPANTAAEALELLNQWVDSPTEERFERICTLIFGETIPLSNDLDVDSVIWWTLRVATSSIGNYEAGWALKSVSSAAMKVRFSDEHLRKIAKNELLSRVKQM